jgi:hypothetical protein
MGLSSKRPSPALGTKQIKDNAVTTAEIRASAGPFTFSGECQADGAVAHDLGTGIVHVLLPRR